MKMMPTQMGQYKGSAASASYISISDGGQNLSQATVEHLQIFYRVTRERNGCAQGFRKLTPAYVHSPSSSSSIRSSWLYLDKRSERQGAPVLI